MFWVPHPPVKRSSSLLEWTGIEEWCVLGGWVRPRPHFSSSSPSLMLLMEAEAPLGEDGGEVLGMAQREEGEGERDGEKSLGGLLLGEPWGENAWIIRPLRSWNICFWEREMIYELGLRIQAHNYVITFDKTFFRKDFVKLFHPQLAENCFSPTPEIINFVRFIYFF